MEKPKAVIILLPGRQNIFHALCNELQIGWHHCHAYHWFVLIKLYSQRQFCFSISQHPNSIPQGNDTSAMLGNRLNHNFVPLHNFYGSFL